MKLPITLLILAKNEAASIGACIKPLRPYVSEIIVCDTGSTDSTVAIAQALGATVIHHPFRNDFSAARNRLLQHARFPWVLMFDADRRIASKDLVRLRSLIACKKYDAYSFVVRNYSDHLSLFKNWSPCLGAYPVEEAASKCAGYYASSVIALFRNHPFMKYTFPLHESLLPCIEKHSLRVKECSLPMHHFEVSKGIDHHARKHLHYLHLGRKMVRRWPKYAPAYFNLTTDIIYLERDLSEAVELTRQLTQLEPNKCWNWNLRGIVALLQARNKVAFKFFEKALALENNADSLCLLGWAQLRMNDYLLAASFFKKALLKKRAYPLCLNLLGVTHERAGDYNAALRCFKRALHYHPSYNTARDNHAALTAHINRC